MKKWAGLLLAFLLLLGATASAAVQLGDRAEDTVSTVEALKASGKFIPWDVVTFSLDGKILDN